MAVCLSVLRLILYPKDYFLVILFSSFHILCSLLLIANLSWVSLWRPGYAKLLAHFVVIFTMMRPRLVVALSLFLFFARYSTDL